MEQLNEWIIAAEPVEAASLIAKPYSHLIIITLYILQW